MRLANGIRVVVMENHALPLVAVRVVAPRGAADVPAGKQGLAYLLVHMLADGSVTRDAATFGRDLARLGASLTADIGLDGSFLTIETLIENLDFTLDLLTEVLRRPRLDGPTLDKVRAVAISEARAQLGRGRGAGVMAVSCGFLGDKVPDAYPPSGDEAGLGRVRLADVIAFYRVAFDPRVLTVIVVGDVTATDVRARLDARLGDWSQPHRVGRVSPTPAAKRRKPAHAPRVLLVDRPAASQVDLVLGIGDLDGIDRTSPDWASLEVMNHVFGGMYGSRVNLLLRETKGYTYAFRSFLLHSRRFAQLSMRSAVNPDVALASIDAIIGEMRRFLADPPLGEEIEQARRVLLTQAARLFTTNAGTAAAFDDIALHGLPINSWANHLTAIDAVGPEDVARVAQRLLVEDRLIVAMVGPVGPLADALASRGLKVRGVNLDRAGRAGARRGCQ
jgi:predicted Zn-dependent peptidase